MRLGIFGGSFDPVHNGHLELARSCQRQALLDEVWFTPTAVQPLKHAGPHATDADRIAMLELAIRGEQRWRVCRLEIDRGGTSYTVDTLRQISEELSGAELFFLMGADAVRDVPHWKEPFEIFRMARPLVVRRAGEQEPDLDDLQAMCDPTKQAQLVEMPAIRVSSSDIRHRIATGSGISSLAPAAVAAYILERKLYQ